MILIVLTIDSLELINVYHLELYVDHLQKNSILRCIVFCCELKQFQYLFLEMNKGKESLQGCYYLQLNPLIHFQILVFHH